MTELLSLYTEKQMNLGEDAKPISEKLNTDVYLIGVFDGLGGAGGRRFMLPNKQAPIKGSWLASRIIRETTLQYFKENCADSFKFYNNISSVLKNLENKLLLSLKESLGKLELNNPPSRLKGSLAIKSLPTTMAACYIADKKGVFIWAGDSRGYILDTGGLHQYTKDDLENEYDALDNITKTSDMSNYVSEAGFILKYHLFPVTYPSIILTATDGCFDWYVTPMHFEHILLLTMQNSLSFKEWKIRLLSAIAEEYKDDSATMSLFCVGWDNFTTMKKYFHPRFKVIIKDYIELIDDKKKENKGPLITSLWEKYKKAYDKTVQNIPSNLGNTPKHIAVPYTDSAEQVPTEHQTTEKSKIDSTDSSNNIGNPHNKPTILTEKPILLKEI